MRRIQMVQAPRSAVPASAALVLAALVGCGGGGTNTITGKVTYRNALVTGGQITLTSTASANNTYSILIKPDGTFMTTGIPAGQYKVAVSTDNVPAPIVTPAGSSPPGVADLGKRVDIPAKYKDPNSSDLTWDVKPGSQEIPVNLAD